ncbi:hypothetical protein [Nocardioides speluncae]|uniref:YxiG-like protein n=1 Tax=Nocardioides speluncae TaxID=2670337 RepID=UPI001981A3F5|nr:hypothetical protein [Nocardioides speluncae]
MTLVAKSAEASAWSRDLGIPFHEVTIETNAHQISLVFSDLIVTTTELGDTPFVVRP